MSSLIPGVIKQYKPNPHYTDYTLYMYMYVFKTNVCVSIVQH